MDRWGAVRARPRDLGRAGSYRLPTEILFGDGVVVELGPRLRDLGLKRPLLVTDPGVHAAGLADRPLASLQAAAIDCPVFADVPSDPPTTVAEAVADRLRAEAHDAVIGFGGGSALDVAKAAAALATNDGPATAYVGRERLGVDPLPFVALPTTAGTGSEVTIWSVLTDPASGSKVSIGSFRMMARLAVLDPELTLGLPPAITAATGMDALSHAVESYGSVWNHAIAEGMALQAVDLVGRHLRRAVRGGVDLDARRGMLMASLIAELAANSTRLGLCHALALPLGARHHVPHGLACALLLPAVVAYNTPAEPERYAEIARRLGGDHAADAIARLRSDIGIEGGLTTWGVGPDDFEALTTTAMRSDNVLANPREADPEALAGILTASL